MKVSVYRLPEGRVDVMVEASPGNGKAPVVLQDVKADDFTSKVLPVVEAQRGRRQDSPSGTRL